MLRFWVLCLCSDQSEFMARVMVYMILICGVFLGVVFSLFLLYSFLYLFPVTTNEMFCSQVLTYVH
jgi:hypothetical protein